MSECQSELRLIFMENYCSVRFVLSASFGARERLEVAVEVAPLNAQIGPRRSKWLRVLLSLLSASQTNLCL